MVVAYSQTCKSLVSASAVRHLCGELRLYLKGTLPLTVLSGLPCGARSKGCVLSSFSQAVQPQCPSWRTPQGSRQESQFWATDQFATSTHLSPLGLQEELQPTTEGLTGEQGLPRAQRAGPAPASGRPGLFGSFRDLVFLRSLVLFPTVEQWPEPEPRIDTSQTAMLSP